MHLSEIRLLNELAARGALWPRGTQVRASFHEACKKDRGHGGNSHRQDGRGEADETLRPVPGKMKGRVSESHPASVPGPVENSALLARTLGYEPGKETYSI